jgi:hypothetical protein
MRQRTRLPWETHTKREWTREDAQILAAAGEIPNLYFAPGVRLPGGFFPCLADARLHITGRLSLKETRLTANDLAAIGRLPGMYGFWLENCPVGDAEIAAFLASGPPPLKELYLVRTRITDASLSGIADALPSLEHLNLSQSGITDEGLAPLSGMPHLTALSLDGTAVTDDGILALARSRRFITLCPKETAITESGLDAYFRAWFMAHRGSNARTPNADDLDACRSLLSEFFAAMNEWELDTEARFQQTRGIVDVDVVHQERHAAVAAIFARFCTAKWHGKNRPHRRNPPTYSRLQFVAEDQPMRNRFHLVAKEDIGATHWYLFVLLRTAEGWRLDARKWMGSGVWTSVGF